MTHELRCSPQLPLYKAEGPSEQYNVTSAQISAIFLRLHTVPCAQPNFKKTRPHTAFATPLGMKQKYQRHFQLPAKSIGDPGRFLKEVAERAGKGNFHIEVRSSLESQGGVDSKQMRHNMYSVTLHDNVDVVS
jgi:hypothetical protein